MAFVLPLETLVTGIVVTMRVVAGFPVFVSVVVEITGVPVFGTVFCVVLLVTALLPSVAA